MCVTASISGHSFTKFIRINTNYVYIACFNLLKQTQREFRLPCTWGARHKYRHRVRVWLHNIERCISLDKLRFLRFDVFNCSITYFLFVRCEHGASKLKYLMRVYFEKTISVSCTMSSRVFVGYQLSSLLAFAGLAMTDARSPGRRGLSLTVSFLPEIRSKASTSSRTEYTVPVPRL